MSAQHRFPEVPKKVTDLKKLDLEALLSFALTSEKKRVKEFTPSLVEIRLFENFRHIDVSFEPGTFPEGYTSFEWLFVKDSEEEIQEIKTCSNLDELKLFHEKHEMDDGVVLKNLFQIENTIGCEVTPRNFDKVYTRIEHLLLNQLFRPAQKVVVSATEGIVAELGEAFFSRNKFHVDELKLMGNWKNTDLLKRVLRGFETEELGFFGGVVLNSIDLSEISIPSKSVHFGDSSVFNCLGTSVFAPFNLEKLEINKCHIRYIIMIMKAWMVKTKGLENLSLLTVEIVDQIGMQWKLKNCAQLPWTVARIKNKYIIQTDSTIFHIEKGYELRNSETGARAFYWSTNKTITGWTKARFLVWSSNCSEISAIEAIQIIAERKREMRRKLEKLDGKEENVQFSGRLQVLKEAIKTEEVKIKSIQSEEEMERLQKKVGELKKEVKMLRWKANEHLVKCLHYGVKRSAIEAELKVD